MMKKILCSDCVHMGKEFIKTCKGQGNPSATCDIKNSRTKINIFKGNSYGIFGCNLHQHDLPMENKSEIVFESKYAAEDFIKSNFYNLYGKGISMNK